MSSTFPTKPADDYVPVSYLRADDAPSGERPNISLRGGDPLRFIAFRSGRRLLAMTALLVE